MEKAILSRINLQRQDTHIAQEYFDTISDLIDTQEREFDTPFHN